MVRLRDYERDDEEDRGWSSWGLRIPLHNHCPKPLKRLGDTYTVRTKTTIEKLDEFMDLGRAIMLT